ncbi:hypothetical protein PH5382_03545 [Phaeobacter sp. CECT 5382]|nr:hypothetical protein PH5382_03545 [Phaeobacter sp. CECT 5382]
MAVACVRIHHRDRADNRPDGVFRNRGPVQRHRFGGFVHIRIFDLRRSGCRFSRRAAFIGAFKGLTRSPSFTRMQRTAAWVIAQVISVLR